MKKTLGAIILVLCSITLAHAKNFSVTSMDVSYAHINAAFLPPGGVDLDVTGTDNLVGGYSDSITMTLLGPAGIQVLYTAESNRNPHGTSIPAGNLPGDDAPTGTVAMNRKMITVDMSSFFSAHGPMDQNLGGIAVGPFHPGTGEYTMSWTATLTQGPRAGQQVTFTFAGIAQVEHIKPSKKIK